MKENKIKIIGSFILMAILTIMMLLSVFLMVGVVVLKKFDINNDKLKELFNISEETSIGINLSEKYPFENESNIIVTNKKNSNKYLYIVNTLKSFLEKKSSSGLIEKKKFVKLSYHYKKELGNKLV